MTGLRIQCAIITSLCSSKNRNSNDGTDRNLGEGEGPLAAPPTNLAFPNLASTTGNFHIEGATDNEEYSIEEVTDVLRVQRAIIDALYNAKDVNPTNRA